MSAGVLSDAARPKGDNPRGTPSPAGGFGGWVHCLISMILMVSLFFIRGADEAPRAPWCVEGSREPKNRLFGPH